MSLSYGSLADAEGQACKKTDKEQGERASFASTATGGPSEGRGSILSILSIETVTTAIDELADSLNSGADVVFDNDEWNDYDEKGDVENDDSKPVLVDTKAEKPTSSKRAGVINLMNNVVGAGILTMPSAVQAASFATALGMMVVTGLISAGSFLLIGYLCSKLQCTTYRQLWSKAFGSRSGIFVDVALLLNSIFGCLTFMILQCDLIGKSFPGLFHTTFTPARPPIIGACTIVVLALCHLKNLAALKYTSILAIGAFAYVFVLVQVKYWQMPAGASRLADNMFKMDSGILFAVSIFNSAYKAHYNAPTYFTELGSMSAFTRVTWLAFGGVMILYIVFCVAAFGMFGNDTKGNILNNFPQGSKAILWAWLAMALCTMFSYPLVFKTGRDCMFTLIPPLGRLEESHPWTSHSAVVTSLVVAISAGACVLPDVALVVGMAGATVGAAICWTIPAAIYMKCALAKPTSDEKEPPIPRSFSLLVSTILLFGISICCMVGCSIVVLKHS